MKIATQDWHPQDHVSFASNHDPPNDKPGSIIAVANPENSSEKELITLWPDHCVQDSFGAQLVAELNASRIDRIVRKGSDKRVEMFSAFKANYTSPCISQSGLSDSLKEAAATEVFVVGLAADHCVKYTAMHSAEEGFETIVLTDATRAIDQSEDAQEALKHNLATHGVAYRTIAEAELGGTDVSKDVKFELRRERMT